MRSLVWLLSIGSSVLLHAWVLHWTVPEMAVEARPGNLEIQLVIPEPSRQAVPEIQTPLPEPEPEPRESLPVAMAEAPERIEKIRPEPVPEPQPSPEDIEEEPKEEIPEQPVPMEAEPVQPMSPDAILTYWAGVREAIARELRVSPCRCGQCRNLTATIRLRLHADGTVADVEVCECRNRDLERAMHQAVKAAAPFHPPDARLVESGRLRAELPVRVVIR